MDEYIFPIIGEESRLPFYITGAGGLANQHYIKRPGGYHQYQFLYCVKGAGLFSIDHKEYKMVENTGFVLYPGIPHEYGAVEEPWETHWITFDGSMIPALLKSLGFVKSEFISIHETRLLDQYIKEILFQLKSNSIAKGFKCSGILYNFLLELKCSIIREASKKKKTDLEKLYPVLSYIEANYSKVMTLHEMADIIGVSPQYLCRLFGRIFNMRPIMYLTKLRLQEAKNYCTAQVFTNPVILSSV